MAAQNTTGRTLWGSLRIYLPALALVVTGFLIAYQFVDPAPPNRVVIATGGTDGAYFHFATRYRKHFAAERVELEVRSTRGSVENLSLLRDTSNDVNLAFVQGGVEHSRSGAADRAGTRDELVALGSVYFEPLWVFHRLPTAPTELRDLGGTRIALGAPGSGTRAIALELLGENGISDTRATFWPLGGSAAADALIHGNLDVVFVVASPTSEVIRRLLDADDIQLMNFARAAAYTRTHPFLSRVVLPRGAIDLAKDVPGKDVQLLAPSATLVATTRLHPAVINLLLQAATEVHRRGGLFEDHGRFPSPEFVDYPLSDEAKRYFKSGPPFLQRFMPFWAATLVDRMLVMLLPIVALLFPLMRVMPPIYQWRMRARVYRWYKELLATDPSTFGKTACGGDGERLSGAGGESLPRAPSVEERLASLRRIEKEVSKVNVPMSFADQLYQLRMHINMVREQLNVTDQGPKPEGPDPQGSERRS